MVERRLRRHSEGRDGGTGIHDREEKREIKIDGI